MQNSILPYQKRYFKKIKRIIKDTHIKYTHIKDTHIKDTHIKDTHTKDTHREKVPSNETPTISKSGYGRLGGW